MGPPAAAAVAAPAPAAPIAPPAGAAPVGEALSSSVPLNKKRMKLVDILSFKRFGKSSLLAI